MGDRALGMKVVKKEIQVLLRAAGVRPMQDLNLKVISD
jgi:hypothetical protein